MPGRRGLKKARSSSTSAWGFSMAGKCPPRSITVKRRMSKCGSQSSRGGRFTSLKAATPVGMAKRQIGIHRSSPIASLRTEAGIAELVDHQARPEIRNLRRVHAALTRAVRESIAGQRGDDHVERVCRVTAVSCRIREGPDHLVHFVEAARPAVGQHERQRLGSLSLDVDEVDSQPVDLGPELGKLVEEAFLDSPIESIAPIGDELLRISEVGPIVPARIRHGVRPTHHGESPPQVLEDGIGDVYPERLHEPALRLLSMPAASAKSCMALRR